MQFNSISCNQSSFYELWIFSFITQFYITSPNEVLPICSHFHILILLLFVLPFCYYRYCDRSYSISYITQLCSQLLFYITIRSLVYKLRDLLDRLLIIHLIFSLFIYSSSYLIIYSHFICSRFKVFCFLFNLFVNQSTCFNILFNHKYSLLHSPVSYFSGSPSLFYLLAILFINYLVSSLILSLLFRVFLFVLYLFIDQFIFRYSNYLRYLFIL